MPNELPDDGNENREVPPNEDLALEQRQELMQKIEQLRDGRVLVCLFNFDRTTNLPNNVPPIGIATQFNSGVKEALYRVLKESVQAGRGVDLCLYTRGGDTNAVWPLVNLIREYDPGFEVLVPFRCHSAGTLTSLGARRIWMTPLAELSPIDPSTGNAFNPRDPTNPQSRLGISVEDVRSYRDFILEQFSREDSDNDEARADLKPFIERLTTEVHPLALGNVHRVHQQIRQLAKRLLGFHREDETEIERIVDLLTTRFFSHLHMISREEATEILGDQTVKATPDDLATKLDQLLRSYEVHFALRRDFYLNTFLGDAIERPARFIGGVVESKAWSYLHETNLILRQKTQLPQGVQVQLPAGQAMPLIPGLPRAVEVEVTSSGWVRNTEPRGFDR